MMRFCLAVLPMIAALVAAFAAPAGWAQEGLDTPVSSEARTEPAGEISRPADPSLSAESAAQPAGQTSVPERAAPPRTLRAYWHVFIAFALTWILLFGYVFVLGRRFARVEREVGRMTNDE